MKNAEMISGVVLSIFLTSFLFVTTADRSDAQYNKFNNLECGDHITRDIRLSSNLYCLSSGLIIENQTGLIIDLNGYSISGPGSANKTGAIEIENSNNIQITGNGTIKDFQVGIWNGGDNNTISNTILEKNEIGIFNSEASNSSILGNYLGSNIIGIASHSSDNQSITENSLGSNQDAGIVFVKSLDNEIISNTVKGSVNGLFFDAQSFGNTIANNIATNNSASDLNNGHGLSISENSNLFKGNICKKSNPQGLCNGIS